MKLHWLDVFTLISYLLIIISVGIYFSRKNTTTEGYFVGNRSYSGWVIGLSMIGTSISSITFLAYPADSFKTSWLRFLPNIVLPIVIITSAYLFLPFFKRKNILSAYEYLEERFGPSVRIYGAITFLIGQLVRISLILYLLSLMVHEVTSLTILQSILLSGITVGFYTILGGIEAVIWTDVIQTITLVFGGLICIGVIIYQLPEGLNQIIDIALLNNKLSFSELKDGVLHPVSWGVSLSNKTGIMMIFLGFSWFFQEYITNQNIIQRYAATKNESEARKAMFISSINIPIWAFFMFLGTALYAYFQVYPSEAASEMLIGTRNAEDILPYFIIYYLPAGISGLIIAAAIAAAMSSLDSSINSISTVGVHDIYRRHLAPNKDDIHYLHIAWYIATFATAIMIIGSCILAFSKMITLQDTYNTIGSVVMGGVLGLYLLGFCTKRGSEKSVWFGIALTMIFSLWTVLAKYSFLPDWLQAPFDLYYTGILGQMIMFAGIFVAAVLFSDSKNNLKNLTIWTKGNK